MHFGKVADSVVVTYSVRKKPGAFMEGNHQQKLAFIQPLTWIALSIVAGTSISPQVLAQPNFDPLDPFPPNQGLDNFPSFPPPAPSNCLSDPRDRGAMERCLRLYQRDLQRWQQQQQWRQQQQTTPQQQEWQYWQREEQQRQRQEEEQRRQAEQQAEEIWQRIQEWSNSYSSSNPTEAEAAFLKIASQYPNNPTEYYARLYYQLGNKLNLQGKLEAAIVVYRQAIRLDSGNAEAYRAIGDIRSNQGQFEAAIAEYQQALSLKPDDADTLKNLGMVLWLQGKRTDAIAFLEKARNRFNELGKLEEVSGVDQLLLRMRE